MEANINIVSGLGTAIDNIYKCVQRAGVEVEDVILEPYASSYSVLSEDEKDVGVALVDIGGGTTDIAIFHKGVIKHINVIAMGGNLLTDDVREVLAIVRSEAERIKKEFGHCYLKSLRSDIILQVPGVNGRNPKEIRKSYLTQILEARMKEIFGFVDKALELSGFKNKLGAGVVITGGSTLLSGCDELAEEVLKCPVKLGIPSKISSRGLAPEVENPIFATSVGLALHGFRNEFGTNLVINTTSPVEKVAEEPEFINHKEEEDVKPEAKAEPKKKKTKEPKEPKENPFKSFLDWVKKIFEQF
jgi:cell division protein FtsA